MVVRKEIRQAIGKSAGDTVKVVMELDTEPRIVVVPTDFQHALENNIKANEMFQAFSYTQKKSTLNGSRVLKSQRPEPTG